MTRWCKQWKQAQVDCLLCHGHQGQQLSAYYISLTQVLSHMPLLGSSGNLPDQSLEQTSDQGTYQSANIYFTMWQLKITRQKRLCLPQGRPLSRVVYSVPKTSSWRPSLQHSVISFQWCSKGATVFRGSRFQVPTLFHLLFAFGNRRQITDWLVHRGASTQELTSTYLLHHKTYGSRKEI